MESFTMSLKPMFGCSDLVSMAESFRLGDLFSGLCAKSWSLIYGSSCWIDLLPSSDEKDEHEEEEHEALDDSIERLLFSVMLLLNVFSCQVSAKSYPSGYFWTPKSTSVLVLVSMCALPYYILTEMLL
uniref:Uncharacterized protein n=1 Tax=Oryza brachyantha TaxID=4533 RepID=J3MMR4_ORYBR